MRRLCVSLIAALVLVASVAVPISAQTGFRAVIHENFERRASAEPCTFDVASDTLSCPGSGHVQGFGRVTSVVEFTPSGVIRTLYFADGSTLILAEEWGTEQSGPPGRSGDAPRSEKSWGWPFFDFGTWAVIGGTGQFADASGSGTAENVQAGDAIVLRFYGSISL